MLTSVFVGQCSSPCGNCHNNMTCHHFKKDAKCLLRRKCPAGRWSASFVMCIRVCVCVCIMYIHCEP